MYRGWVVRRWETAVSDIPDLAMVSLSDQNRHLEIVVQSLRDPSLRRWRVSFERYSAYRNTDETFLPALWEYLDESGQRCGNTFTFEGSNWDGTGPAHLPSYAVNARHFVLATLDDVIEVVSSNEPTCGAIEPAEPNSPPPGKAVHYFLPDDRQAVKGLVRELRVRRIIWKARKALRKAVDSAKRLSRKQGPG
ncbi:MAG: hypothetical protein GXY76_19795 [Chloroflexi bacterium]|nr:hypothetical protein [Chloroflexota bacterium]